MADLALQGPITFAAFNFEVTTLFRVILTFLCVSLPLCLVSGFSFFSCLLPGLLVLITKELRIACRLHLFNQ